MSELVYNSVGTMDSLRYFLPELSLLGVFLVVFFMDLAMGREQSRWTGPVGVIGLFCVLVITLMSQGRLTADGSAGVRLFSGMVVADPIAVFFKVIFLATAAITILMSWKSSELKGRRLGEYVGLLLLLCMGLFLMSSSTNLLMFYISMEVVSYLSYVLVGFVKGDRKGSEAALKYVLFGSVSSGAMLFGISILYGLTGTLDLLALTQNLIEGANLAMYVGTSLVLVGIGYKISAVPFHFWTPDVYEGANTPMTAFLSVASKAAGFALLIRFVFFGVSGLSGAALGAVDWQRVLMFLSIVTMTLGNFVALHQKSMKRLLAYSSIAHAGYVLMGLSTLNHDGLFAALFYFAIYLLMNLGAFLVIISLRDRIESEDQITSYIGLGRKFPMVAILMGVFLFSLTGVPPFGGFIGKFYLFAAVIKAGFYKLAVIGVLNSVVSLFYYARILRAMFLARTEDEEAGIETPAPAHLSAHVIPLYSVMLVMLAVPTVLLGIYWAPLQRWVESSVGFLF
ncbi:MAG: NADH-quinone oxidoreductase subunit N [Candidatus Eisenbacteria bacterium]|uniref:NADH-quinone oxidoreductase subunit N n=1 Tax=Eiseniibacteriota bacterium TaxID=2212470 RepID=A0A948RU32_UNCEI|nr:NADH-quinone oxidoreductase subunit N [Candidatus Eisenbacteria bacterium]MBU1949422.1 NADH-quinone oxidoreductase subunit N [Candidatus Eisenbacteria bacterium]MBU2689578.1 NADH-quinone oxidoreductase subunit N [Candidatus Eisenbacteria bacterium]